MRGVAPRPIAGACGMETTREKSMAQVAFAEAAKLRPDVMLAKPVWLDPAFEDPDAVVDLVRASAPYPLSARVHKRDDNGQDVPFFRIFWAHTRQVRVPGTERFFYNERFMEAAKESFGATVIIPSAIMINISTPTIGGPPHRDLPYFRGAEKFPFWLLKCMGNSDLFHPWAVPIASTLSWFYRGEAGDFEYWPEGPNAPSKLVQAPLWNVGIVSDNEYMWHRVGAVGPEAQRKQPGEITREVRLHASDDGGWEMHDQGKVEKFPADKARISILWKAYAFADEAAEAEYRNHENDLNPGIVADIFRKDLDRQGIAAPRSDDPVADPAWKSTIQKNYEPKFQLRGEATYKY